MFKVSKSSFKLLARKNRERIMRKRVQSQNSALVKRVPDKEYTKASPRFAA